MLCTDPHVRDETLVPLDAVLREAEVLIVGTPHDEYRGLQVRPGVEVVDGVGRPSAGEGGEAGVSGDGEKVLVTGSAGFIAGYLVQELLDHGYRVVGVDNFSKYGRVSKSYDAHPRLRPGGRDCRDPALLKSLVADCDHLVAGRRASAASPTSTSTPTTCWRTTSGSPPPPSTPPSGRTARSG